MGSWNSVAGSSRMIALNTEINVFSRRIEGWVRKSHLGVDCRSSSPNTHSAFWLCLSQVLTEIQNILEVSKTWSQAQLPRYFLAFRNKVKSFTLGSYWHNFDFRSGVNFAISIYGAQIKPGLLFVSLGSLRRKVTAYFHWTGGFPKNCTTAYRKLHKSWHLKKIKK